MLFVGIGVENLEGCSIDVVFGCGGGVDEGGIVIFVG